MMKNNVLLRFDESRWLLKRLFRKCYCYPVVYTDGLISRFVDASEGRTAWGILINDWIVSLNPAPEKMPYKKAKEYCRSIVFSGVEAELVPMTVMETIVCTPYLFNEVVTALGGKEITSQWYLVENDRYLTGEFQLALGAYVVRPFIRHFAPGVLHTVEAEVAVPFYPAVCLRQHR